MIVLYCLNTIKQAKASKPSVNQVIQSIVVIERNKWMRNLPMEREREREREREIERDR